MTTVPFGSSGLAKRASYTGTAKRDRLEAGYENFKIGVMIHQARLEKGLTQEELAAPMFYRGQNRSLQSCFLHCMDHSKPACSLLMRIDAVHIRDLHPLDIQTNFPPGNQLCHTGRPTKCISHSGRVFQIFSFIFHSEYWLVGQFGVVGPGISQADLPSPPMPATTYTSTLVATLYKQDSFMMIFRTTIILLLLTSCGDRIEREKLIGRYAWNDGRIDTLELRADGSYEYWTFAPGQKFANSGKWKLNPILNEVEFELENFPFLKNHVPEGSWFSQLRSRDNEVHLMYTTDSDIYLKKIKPLGCVKN